MDSFEWNKIAGAVLFACLIVFGLSIFSETLFETEAPESPGYFIAVAEPGEGAGGEEAPASQPIGVLLAAADVAAGESSARKCGACHTFGSGEANKVGPNLWDVVDRPIAGHEGYEYDDAMETYAQEANSWTYEHLNTFLHDPKGTVPGTKMAFAGLRNDEERANVIAYLRSLSDSPKPLPPAEPAAAEAGGEDAAADAGTDATAPAEAAQDTAQTGAPPAAESEAPAAGQQTATAEAPATEAPAAAESAPAEPATPAPAQQTAQAEAPAAAEAPAEPAPAEGAAPAAEEAASAFASAVASADLAKGETFAKRCIACHSFDEGGANKVGPNLWSIVDRPIATVADYAYSDAMKAFAEGGKAWDYDTLHTYLADPRGVVPGTKMIFPGIKNEADVANVVAYLRTLAAEPAPLPAQ